MTFCTTTAGVGSAIPRPKTRGSLKSISLAPGRSETLIRNNMSDENVASRQHSRGPFGRVIATAMAIERARTRCDHREQLPAMARQPLRIRGGERSLGAAHLLVTIVEIEKNFANVAAMAGMASGYVGNGDWCGHLCR